MLMQVNTTKLWRENDFACIDFYLSIYLSSQYCSRHANYSKWISGCGGVRIDHEGPLFYRLLEVRIWKATPINVIISLEDEMRIRHHKNVRFAIEFWEMKFNTSKGNWKMPEESSEWNVILKSSFS